jgi:hypothetical protein
MVWAKPETAASQEQAMSAGKNLQARKGGSDLKTIPVMAGL